MACDAHISTARAAPYAIAPTTAGHDECQAANLCNISCTYLCHVQVDTAPDFQRPQLASLDTLKLTIENIDEEPDFQVSSANSPGSHLSQGLTLNLKPSPRCTDHNITWLTKG